MEITIDATGAAPAGSVWERCMNPDDWSSWAPHIFEVQFSEQRVTAGLTGRALCPLWLRIDFDILDVDEAGWTWTWRAWWKHRKIGLTLTQGVASRTDGSRTWVTVEGAPALVVPYAPVAKLALMRLTRQ